MIKTILELIIYIYTYFIKYLEDQTLMSMLSACDDGQRIKQNGKAYVYFRKLVILRREMRFIRVEIFIYTMRLIMLTGNLKLIGHKYLDPVFVSMSGLCQAYAVVFKAMKSKKNFLKLDVEDLKDKIPHSKTSIVPKPQAP